MVLLSEQDTAIFVESSFFECTDTLAIFLCAWGHIQTAQLIACPEKLCRYELWIFREQFYVL